MGGKKSTENEFKDERNRTSKREDRVKKKGQIGVNIIGDANISGSITLAMKFGMQNQCELPNIPFPPKGTP